LDLYDLFVGLLWKSRKKMVPSTARLFPVQDYICVISVFFPGFLWFVCGAFCENQEKKDDGAINCKIISSARLYFCYFSFFPGFLWFVCGAFCENQEKKMVVPSTARLFPVQDYICVISVF